MPSIARPSDLDQEIFARELDNFVPDDVFDAHAHLWERHHLPPASEADTHTVEDVIGIDVHRSYLADLMPGRRIVGGLFLPRARRGDATQIAVRNEFVARQVADHPASRGGMLIAPHMDPEWVRQEVQRLGLAGLKCYHLQCDRTPSWDADIPDYLPEPFVGIAHEESLTITLHMVKERAVADPSNQHWIRRYCESYPHMRMVLAHAARGFNAQHAWEGLPALRGLDNLWCDMSAITEAGACEAVIETLGSDRLLFGTDFPVSHLRGRCVTIGDQFIWLYEDTLAWEKASFRPVRPALIGIESLRALKETARALRLTDSQIEDIFSRNAAHLFI